jgi:hypothetical protein
MRTLAIGSGGRPAILIAFLLLAGAAPATFTVTLWANDDSVAGRPDVVETGPHPCGAVARVRLVRMPPAGTQGALSGELVVATGGGPTLRWSVPVGYRPLALRGAEILVDHDGQRLWIHTDGSLRRELGRRAWPPLRPRQCAADGPHSDSDYARCAAVTDLATRAGRILHYESDCT